MRKIRKLYKGMARSRFMKGWLITGRDVRSRFIKSWLRTCRDILGVSHILNNNEKKLQSLAALMLQQKYPSLVDKPETEFEINKHEFKLYSQNGEDGILLYIFSRIGVTNRCLVEFGIEERECNTANLLLNFGWQGLLMDSSKQNVLFAKQYYKNMLGPKSSNIRIIHCLVTKENINTVLRDNAIEGAIDLLSIDIDGNDYWVWQAITAIDPRVVIIEYNASFGSDKSLTVKYDAKFNVYAKHYMGFYHGASLVALTKLANSKGYVLVGCDSHGVNAFFVRKDVAQGILDEVSVEDAYYANYLRYLLTGLSTSEQFDSIKHLDFYHV